MKDSARYVKIVEWSDVDNCYVGRSPGLLYGGCHGDDERLVFEELCQIVDEPIDLYHADGKPLPPATSGRDFANKMQDVACVLGQNNPRTTICRQGAKTPSREASFDNPLRPRALATWRLKLQITTAGNC